MSALIGQTAGGISLNPVYSATGVGLEAVDASPFFPPLSLTLVDGFLHGTLAGGAGQSYRVEASSDLVDWVAIATEVIPGSTLWEFVDPDATAEPFRFYRAVFISTP